MSTAKGKPEEPPPHPVEVLISEFDSTISTSRKGLRLILVPALHELRTQLDAAGKKMDQALAGLRKKRALSQIKSYAELDEALLNMENIADVELFDRVVEGQFVGLFAIFDGYIGELISKFFELKPELYSKINGELKYSSVFSCASLSELKSNILDSYIDSFRRKSYADQFTHLEELFGVALKKFDRWPNFIECAQRRNLVTHCRGVVSTQYIKCCKEAGFPVDVSLKVGAKLEISAKYFVESAALVQEVGIMLAHTLWRKVLEKDIDKADENISDMIYRRLKQKQWKQAVRLGEFAFGQKKHSSEQGRLIVCVNYCIALREIGNKKKVRAILDSMDMSGCIPEFRLAKYVLLEEFDLAAETMKSIGRQGELLAEQSYHVWPLFLSFRASKQFQDAYRRIYRRDFVATVQSEAEATKARSEDAISKAESPLTKTA